ncbi:MAG: hypothetical protein HC889_00035 [Synechococcaceae cyanobacterium SM1_2_3]|nr:hypothetical protein [Synechococcaceae cyanobacterium SM1_2_3]
MLSDEEKARIRAEEEFRRVIQQQLAKQDPPQTTWQQVFSLLNTNVGGWFLSTVLVGTAGFVATAVHNKWTASERQATEIRQRSHQEAEMVTRLLPWLAKTGDAPEQLIAISIIGHLKNRGGIDPIFSTSLDFILNQIAVKGAGPTASPEERKAAETVVASVDALSRAQTTLQSGNTLDTPLDTKPLTSSQREQKLPADLITKPLPTRVYIHIANEGQRKKAEEIQSKFRNKGIIAPNIIMIGEKSPTQPEVRFFNKEDKETADQINKLVREAGISVSDSPKRPSLSARLGHLELWFQK